MSTMDGTPMSQVSLKRDATFTYVILAVIAVSLVFWLLLFPNL